MSGDIARGQRARIGVLLQNIENAHVLILQAGGAIKIGRAGKRRESNGTASDYRLDPLRLHGTKVQFQVGTNASQ
jgi:hypothetical protein